MGREHPLHPALGWGWLLLWGPPEPPAVSQRIGPSAAAPALRCLCVAFVCAFSDIPLLCSHPQHRQPWAQMQPPPPISPDPSTSPSPYRDPATPTCPSHLMGGTWRWHTWPWGGRRQGWGWGSLCPPTHCSGGGGEHDGPVLPSSEPRVCTGVRAMGVHTQPLPPPSPLPPHGPTVRGWGRWVPGAAVGIDPHALPLSFSTQRSPTATVGWGSPTPHGALLCPPHQGNALPIPHPPHPHTHPKHCRPQSPPHSETKTPMVQHPPLPPQHCGVAENPLGRG